MTIKLSTVKICEHCVEAIRSHGENLIVLQNLYEEGVCEWCEEKTDDLVEAMFADD